MECACQAHAYNNELAMGGATHSKGTCLKAESMSAFHIFKSGPTDSYIPRMLLKNTSRFSYFSFSPAAVAALHPALTEPSHQTQVHIPNQLKWARRHIIDGSYFHRAVRLQTYTNTAMRALAKANNQ